MRDTAAGFTSGKKSMVSLFTGHRIHTSSDRSIRPRLLNYFSFVFSSLLVGIFRTGRYDYIFCESPPLFLGISAFLLKTFKRSRLIFNVSDLWPESAEKLGLVSNRFLLKISRCLEEFLYRKSWLICGQTQGIVKSISARFPSKTVFWLKNGADVSELEAVETVPGFRGKLGFSDDDFLLLYAGILGMPRASRLFCTPLLNFVTTVKSNFC